MRSLKQGWRVAIGAIVVVLLVGLASAVYMLTRESEASTPVATGVLESVSRHFLLPADEEPAILTVVNKDRVSSAFLKGKVEDGDKVLIYQKSQKAIIYRPSLDRVIDAGPAIVDDVKKTAQ